MRMPHGRAAHIANKLSIGNPQAASREFLSLRRVVLCVVALSLIVAGIFLKYSDIGKTLIGLGAGVLLAAVVVPAVSRVEFGFPSGVKVTAAVPHREEKLRQVFEQQRPDLEECAKLLCDYPPDRPEPPQSTRPKTRLVGLGRSPG